MPTDDPRGAAVPVAPVAVDVPCASPLGPRMPPRDPTLSERPLPPPAVQCPPPDPPRAPPPEKPPPPRETAVPPPPPLLPLVVVPVLPPPLGALGPAAREPPPVETACPPPPPPRDTAWPAERRGRQQPRPDEGGQTGTEYLEKLGLMTPLLPTNRATGLPVGEPVPVSGKSGAFPIISSHDPGASQLGHGPCRRGPDGVPRRVQRVPIS